PDDLTKAPLVYLGKDGVIKINILSPEFKVFTSANTVVAGIKALEKLGIKFSATPEEVIKVGKGFNDAFSSIYQQLSKGNITTFDDLFGKQIVNGPINKLLEIELKFTADDTILSHQTAEGKTQYSITLPSAASNIVNTLKNVNTLSDFILSNPQYGSVNVETGEVVLNSYQLNSKLFAYGGPIFD